MHATMTDFVHLSTCAFNCEYLAYKIVYIGQIYFCYARALRKLNLNEILQLLKNCARVKLIFVRLRRRQQWKTMKQLLFPV